MKSIHFKFILMVNFLRAVSTLPLDKSGTGGLPEILIDEFLLPTEPNTQDYSIGSEIKENSTFHELVERYSEIYSNEDHLEATEIPIEFRTIEKRDIIATTEISSSYLTPAFRSVQDKENFQVHVIEQLVHMTDYQQHGSGDSEFTTILPEQDLLHHEYIKNPEVVEVLENIMYEMDRNAKHEISTQLPGIIEIQIDAISIIPKDHHQRLRNLPENIESENDEKNDKFVGFKPAEDLLPPGEETTEPDRFFKTSETEEIEKQQEDLAEIVYETLKIVGEFGRDLKDKGNEKVIDKILSEAEESDGRALIPEQQPTTLRTLFETFEEVITTISDGIRLSKDVQGAIDSFRDYNEGN